MKKECRSQTWIFPRPVVLVSARKKSGRDTIAAVSWAGGACSEPPMISVALRKSRYVHECIMETKEFVANIPTAEQVSIVNFCGTESGADVDKFVHLKLTREKGTKVSAPMVGECPINLECKVKDVLELGTHDLFLAEVVNVHLDENLLGPKGELDEKKMNPIAWLMQDYYSLKTI